MANAIDPRLFAGRENTSDTQFNRQGAGGDGSTIDQSVSIDSVMDGTPLGAQSDAVQTAADRIRATRIESIGAGLRDSIVGRIYDRFEKPAFEVDKDFQFNEFVDALPMQLSEDEFDYIKDARSTAEAQFKYEHVQEVRQRQQTMGDNAFTAMAGTLMGDPALLLGTALTGGVGAVAGAGRVGRVAAGAANAAATAGSIVAGEGPYSTSDLITNSLMNGAAGAWVYKPGKGLVKKDPDFPDEALTELAGEAGRAPVKPKVRRGENGQWEEVPATLQPGAVGHAPADVVKAVDKEISRSASFGENIQWNIRKTMSGYGPVGKKIADILFDNNSDLSLTSMESHRAAIRQELTSLQRGYEDSMRSAMAEDGFGIWGVIRHPRQAAAAQANIESAVQQELWRREQMQRLGRPIQDSTVSPRIAKMADQLDDLHARALKELKAAGVNGAEELAQKAGWHHRKWSSSKMEDAMEKFKTLGLDDAQARTQLTRLVGLSIRRGSENISKELADDMGQAVVSRAMRKGYFEDNILSGGATEGMLKEVRDMLHHEGIRGPRAERVLDVLRTNTDEVGKEGFLKHRVDLDYRAAVPVNGSLVRVTDLLDNRLTHTVDQYLDGVSTQAALARKGIKSQSDVAAMRTELLHDIKDPNKRREAANLFDQSMNHFYGRPVGQEMHAAMRNMVAYGRMISLAFSGLWQTTEYATMMGKYGVLKTVKAAMQELPSMRTLFSDLQGNPALGRQLKNVLTEHSSNNVRLRPFTNRFEDNFEYGTADTATLLAHQGSQLVPYANAMKYIHSHQAKVASNLIIDRLEQAGKGNVKARQALEKYGLGSQVADKLKAQIDAHGYNVDAWDDAVWADVRPAFGKMMDEAVLHSRLGDMPAFAKFDNLGKFIFTYRSFMLTAHNKILAGSMARDGAAPTLLMMAYQFPLAAAAVQAQSVMQGKGTLSEADMAKKALGQMGGLGFGSEIAGVWSGQKRGWGSPGLIPVDRGIELAGPALRGDLGNAAGTAAQMVPVLSLTPARNLGKLLED